SRDFRLFLLIVMMSLHLRRHLLKSVEVLADHMAEVDRYSVKTTEPPSLSSEEPQYSPFIYVAGHSATLVRARSMLRTGHSVPDLTVSMARTARQVIPPSTSFTSTYEAGHSATLVRARPVLSAGHSAPDFS
ncbi:17215_t:CDS:2, partial [Acaulospora morrowiae]